MAENKKSIIVYSDWIELFESLTDDEAGKLIKHFFRYVNDKNPTAPDRITELSFIPIKQSLKRDLEKWEDKLSERSINGRKGNLKKYDIDIYNEYVSGKYSLEEAEEVAKRKKDSHSDKNNRIAIKNVAKVADSVSVNDSVSVSVSVNDNVNINNKKPRVNKFTPPAILDVKNYFLENGYTLESGEKAFNYYNIADWKDSNGRKVVNWKQKMQSVWFKEENKLKEKRIENLYITDSGLPRVKTPF